MVLLDIVAYASSARIEDTQDRTNEVSLSFRETLEKRFGIVTCTTLKAKIV